MRLSFGIDSLFLNCRYGIGVMAGTDGGVSFAFEKFARACVQVMITRRLVEDNKFRTNPHDGTCVSVLTSDCCAEGAHDDGTDHIHCATY